MIRKFLYLLAAITTISGSGFSKPIATFTTSLTQPTYGLNIPVEINLDEITFVPDSTLILSERIGDKLIPVAFQISHGEHRILHWIINSKSNPAINRVYELTQGNAIPDENLVEATREDGTLIIHAGKQNLLGYRYATMYPPAGIDSVYRRSGFIHPLWSPHGQILTRIQPPDHYHHYGIWNSWARVLFEADTVDFWNLKDRLGTGRFVNFVAIENGPIFGEFRALLEHIAFKHDGSKKAALNELQTVRVYNPNGRDEYIVDITIELSCASESPVVLLEYRYGGMGWRATEQWNKDNSEILTSEGRTRLDADGNRARWCIVQGEVDNAYAGAVMMSCPTNYNHPEPMRVWPVNMNERGDVYTNFWPMRNMDWALEPGGRYCLKYRFLVFNNHYSKEKAEAAWQGFAEPHVTAVIGDR
ncbi:PmoA family protein [candidate division KSB1 bacterium]|nr:PmoA family protein [candidate division KSB1 bacterium]